MILQKRRSHNHYTLFLLSANLSVTFPIEYSHWEVHNFKREFGTPCVVIRINMYKFFAEQH